jgi:hypothetical protein
VPHLIFAHVDVVPKLGHRWVRQSGLLRRQTEDQLFTLRWGTGSKLANRITGYIGVKLNGPTSGHLNKSHRVAVTQKSANAHTMMLLILCVAGFCGGSGVG